MPPSSQSAAVARTRQAPRDVVIGSWPLIEGDAWAWGTLTVAGLLVAVASAVSDSAATGGVLAALLLLAQWRLLVPARYEIGAGGVTRTLFGRTKRIAWSAVGGVERQSQGVLVLHEAGRSAVSTLRGVFIPYGQHEAEVTALFDHYLAGRAAL